MSSNNTNVNAPTLTLDEPDRRQTHTRGFNRGEAIEAVHSWAASGRLGLDWKVETNPRFEFTREVEDETLVAQVRAGFGPNDRDFVGIEVWWDHQTGYLSWREWTRCLTVRVSGPTCK